MKHSLQHINKWKTVLVVLITLLSAGPIYAQCPTPGLTAISQTDEQCYQADDGTITFRFTDGTHPSAFDYRVQLYDFDTGGFVYDDNNPPFLNAVPAPGIDSDSLKFTNVPPGDYALVLSGGSCGAPSPSSTYGLGYSGLPNSAVRIDAATEIIVNPASVFTTGDTQCTGPFDGEIDITGALSGGTNTFEYSIDAGANYQASPVFSNLEDGAYTIRIRDGNGCIKDTAGIVVNDIAVAPTATISPNPAEACISIDLAFNGNPVGGTPGYTHSWTGDIASLSDPNVVNPDFNSAATGTFNLTYTVTDAKGCTGTDNITVNVNNPPVAGLDNTIDVCEGDNNVDLFANLGGTPDGGGNWIDAGDNPVGATFDPSGAGVGIFVFRYIVSGVGCPNDTAAVTVNVNAGPDAGTNNTIDVCESDTNVDLFASLGGTPDVGGNWIDAGDNPVGANFDANAAGVGIYVFRYVVSGIGCPNDTAAVTVNVNAGPDAGTDNTIDVCESETNVDLFGSLLGTPDVGGNWIDAGDNPVGATFDANAAGIGIYTFRYIISGVGCPNDTASVTVNVNLAPDPGTDNAIDVCESETNVDLFGSLLGTPDVGGNWIDAGDNPVGATFDPSGAGVGIFVFRYIVSGVGCPNDTATVTVNVNIAPNPGTDNTIDACESETNVDLFANLGGTPDGGGNWIDAGDNPVGSTFDANAAGVGIYVFRYIVSGVGCPNDTASVTVNVNLAPDPGTDNTIDACASEINVDLFANLGGTPDGGGNWIDAGDNPVGATFDANAAGVGIYVFRYIVSGVGCPNDTASVTVNVNLAPDPGTDNTIDDCASETNVDLFASLGGTPDGGGNWIDAGDNPVGSTFDANAAGVGTFVFRYIVSGTGCPNDTASVTVNVITAPDPGTDNAIDVCDSETNVDLFGSLLGTPDVGGNWIDAGDNPVGATFDANAAGVGIYVFRYVVSGIGCPNDTASVTVNVNTAPNPGTDNAIDVCESETSVDLFANLGGTPDAGGNWIDAGDNPVGANFDANAAGVGIYVFRYIVSGVGCPNDTAAVTVNVTGIADAGEDGSLNACTAETTLDLTNGLSVSAQPGGTWNDDDGSGQLTGSIFDAQAAGVGTYHFTYTIMGTAPCSDSSATITVTVVTAPNAGTDGSLDACTIETAIDLFTGLGGTPDAGGTWEDLDGTLALSGNLFDASLVTAGTYNFRYVLVAAGCTNDTSLVSVDVYEVPDAGNNNAATVCVTQTAYDLTTALTASAQAGGTWNDDDGTTALSGSNFNASSAGVGTWHFTYTVAGTGTCPDSSAVITVNVVTAPDAGNNNTISVCETDNTVDLFTNLGGTPDGGGTWNDDDATGALASGIFDATAVAVPGTYNFTYTVNAAGCGSDMAIVTINVIATPDAGTDNTANVCASEIAFNLNSALTGSAQPGGTWNDDDATGELSGDLFNAQNAGPGIYDFTYTVAGTAFCPDSSATITITVLLAPNAGNDTTITVCETVTSVDLFSNLAGTPDGGGSWNDDDGSLALTGNIFDPSATAGPGTYNFTYTVAGGGTCADATAIVTVNVSAGPTVADAGTDSLACNLSIDLYGNTPLAGTGQWTQINGPGTLTFSDAASPSSTVDASVAGAYDIEWEITNGGCASKDTVKITFGGPITVGLGGGSSAYLAGDACNISPHGQIFALPSGGFASTFNDYTYEWKIGDKSYVKNVFPFNQSRNDTPPGIITVFVTDLQGCTGQGAGVIQSQQPNSPIINFTASNVDCANDSTGSVNVQITAGASTGVGNYELFAVNRVGDTIQQYVQIPITGPTTNYVLNNLGAGTYFVSVKDLTLGATDTCATNAKQVLVTQPPAITYSNVNITDVTCKGASNGSISAEVGGGTAPYVDFEWTDQGGNPVVSNETGGTVTEITGQPAGFYQLKITDTSGCQDSTTFEITEPATGDPAPTTTIATDIACDSLVVNWNNSTGATAYRLDVSLDNFTTFLPSFNDKNVALALSDTIGGLTANTTVYYRVRAITSCGPTANSDTAVVNTLPNEAAPDISTPPFGFSDVSCDTLVVSWGNVAGATSYELDLSFNNFTSVTTSTNVGLNTSETINALSPNQTVYVRVRAFTGCGPTTYSDTISTTTADVPLPPDVAIGASDLKCDSLVVNWGVVPGATNYLLDVSQDNFVTFIPGFDNKDVNLALKDTIGGLGLGDTVYYRVRALTSCGITINSDTVITNTLDIPDAPITSGASDIGCDSLVVNWNPVTGATDYLLDVSTDINFATFLAGFNDKSTGIATSDTIRGLSAQDTLYYRVRTMAACGISIYSDTAMVISSDVPPGPDVTMGVSDVGCDSLVVNWAPITGTTNYLLDVSLDNFATFIFNDKNVGTNVSDTVRGLNLNETVYYRVRAVLTCGTTVYSDTVVANTLDIPIVPDVTAGASSIGCDTLVANWNNVPTATSYRIDVSLDDFATFLVQDSAVVTNSFIIRGLISGDSIYYRVRAENGCGISGYSDTTIVRTLLPAQCGYACTFDAAAVGGNVTCDGDTDGNIVVFVISGGSGNGNYLYKIDGAPTFSTFSGGFITEIQNQPQGNYDVVIMDNVTGCMDTAKVSVGVGTTLFASFDKENITCENGNGSISLLVAGGSGDYTFDWTGPNGYTANTRDIFGLTEGGDYTVDILDNINNCAAQFTINIASPTDFTFAGSSVNDDNCNSGTGSVDVKVIGTGAYTISGDLVEGLNNNLIGGSYAVTITDAAGCSRDTTFTVQNITNFTISVAVDSVSCGSTDDGAIDITVTGPNTYSFTGQLTAASTTGLVAGDYNVTIRDEVTNCEKDTTISVFAKTVCGSGCGLDLAKFTIDPVNVNCPGGEDGAFLINLLPGSGVDASRFQYTMDTTAAWNAGGTSPGLVYAFDDLSMGEYKIFIRDTLSGVGCPTIKEITKTIASQNNFVINTQAESCVGSDGSITLALPTTCTDDIIYSFIWVDPVGNTIGVDMMQTNNLMAGNYTIFVQNSVTGLPIETLTVTVANNCSGGGPGGGELCMLGNKSVDVSTTPFDCENGGGSVTLSVIGGGAVEYNFRIVSTDGLIDISDTETGLVTFSGLPSGDYEYRVIDNSGSPSCQSTFSIGENSVVISSVGITMPACDDLVQEASLLVTLDVATTAFGPYEVFALRADNPADTVAKAIIDDGLKSTTLTGLPIATAYVVQVHSADVKACAGTRNVTIPTGEIVSLSFDHEATDIVCFGDGGVVSITNIVASENTPFTINLYKAGIDDPVESIRYTFIPSIHLFNDLEFGDYQVQIVQEQNVCGGVTITESTPTFSIAGPSQALSYEITEIVEVTVDRPEGDIIISEITGGGLPYQVRIVNDPAGNSSEWIEVVNNNPVIDPYEYVFERMELGNYKIEVKDAFGCSIIRDVKVKYTSELFIPNIFTPNNDGENDTFRIVNLDLFTQGDEGANIIITSRWGNVVYESKAYNNITAWDGGEYPDGMYFYRLTLPNEGGTFTGWIELWRGRRP